MSKERAVAFLERLRTDDAFRGRVLDIEDLTERERVINTEGFDCTNAEIEAVYAGLSELADADLADVSGGAMVLPRVMLGECSFTCYGGCHSSGYGCRA